MGDNGVCSTTCYPTRMDRLIMLYLPLNCVCMPYFVLKDMWLITAFSINPSQGAGASRQQLDVQVYPMQVLLRLGLRYVHGCGGSSYRVCNLPCYNAKHNHKEQVNKSVGASCHVGSI